MAYAEKYSNGELMAATVARLIRNDDIAVIGMGIPLLAGVVAINSHAPEVIIVYECGGLGPRSRRIPFSVADNPTTDNAIAAYPMWTILGDCQNGYYSLAVIGGAEVDRFGNLNSTLIPGEDGDFAHPKVRLPGTGGANDLAVSAQRTIIMMRMQKNKFVEKVGYLSTPGYLSGAGEREKLGFPGKGPEAVVTDKCVLRFDETSKEMYLDAIFPGVTVEQIKSIVQWDLKVSPQLSEVELPTEEQISIMHTFDPQNLILGGSRGALQDDSEAYYQSMKKAYNAVKL